MNKREVLRDLKLLMFVHRSHRAKQKEQRKTVGRGDAIQRENNTRTVQYRIQRQTVSSFDIETRLWKSKQEEKEGSNKSSRTELLTKKLTGGGLVT